MAILKIKDKGVWKEIQAIKGDTGHDVYVGNKSEAPSESKLIIEPIRRTSTGTDIQINDTISDKTSIKLDGKSTQETRSGKNLFKPLNNTSYGITTTYDKNGVGTIKGTSTSKWTNISGNVIYSYPAGNYALSIDKPKTFNVNIKGTYTDKEVFEFSIFAGSKTKNVAFKKEVYSMYAYISGFEAGATFNETIKIQLEEGSTATDYEPYGVSPSPDYPSEIENIKGKNLINIDDKNYVDPLISVDKDGWITATYDNTNGATTKFMNYFTNNLNLKTSSKYNAIVEVKSVSGSGVLTLLSSMKNYGQAISGKSFNFNKLSNNSIYNSVFTTKSSFVNITQGIRTYVMFNAGESGSITFRLSVLEDISDFKYVPYGNIQIVETGKNLLDTSVVQTIKNQNGENRNGYYCQISKKGRYYLLLNTTNAMYFGKSTDLEKASTLVGASKPNYSTFLDFNEGDYFIIWGTKTDADRLMVANSPTATSYEPYTEEVVNIDLKGNELCSLPNETKDDLIVKDGRAKILKKIGEVVLDGSETITGIWRDAETTHIFKISDIKLDNLYTTLTNTDEVFAMCDYFKVHPYDAGANSIWAIRKDNNDFKNALAIINTKGNANYKNIIVKHSGCVTSAEFKAWLQANPVVLQYELKEPYEIDLGSVDSLNTFEGTTYISNSEDANMEVEYSIIGTPDVKYKTGADALKDLFPKNVSEFSNDSGYITDENLEPAISTYVTAHKDELKGEQGDPGTTTYSELSDKPQIQYKALEENENVLQQINKTVTLEDIKNLIDLGIYQFIPFDMSSYTSSNKLNPHTDLPDGLYVVTSGGTIDVIADSWDLEVGSRIFKNGDYLSLLTDVGDMFYYYDSSTNTYIGGFYVNSSDMDSTIQSYLLDYILKPKVKRTSVTSFVTKLEDNNMYRVIPTNGVTKFSMTYNDASILPTKTFNCHITLKTSKTSIEATEPTISTKFIGTDCENGSFTPKVGMIYDMEIVWNGIDMVANVNGYAW